MNRSRMSRSLPLFIKTVLVRSFASLLNMTLEFNPVMYATVPTAASFTAKVHLGFDLTQACFLAGMTYLSLSALVF